MPKVSVILPLYNGSKHLKETIESVLAQSYKDFEFIIVNDGSTDHPELILDSYKNKLKIIDQANSGCPASAKNRGIQESTGKYLAFIDQDDLWDKEKLEKQVKILDNDPKIGLVLANCSVFDSETSQVYGTLWAKINNYNTEYLSTKLLEDNFVITTSQAMVRKDIFADEYFDDEMKLADDYELWFRISKQWKIYLMNEVLTKWRFSPKSLSNDNVKMLNDLVYFYNKALDNYKLDECEVELAKRKSTLYLVRLGNLLARKGLDIQAHDSYLKAKKMGDQSRVTSLFLHGSKYFPFLTKTILLLKLKLTKHTAFFPTINLSIGTDEK